MSLLERRVSDLERLLRASELENSTLKRALHFSSQPTNKDSDEKEQNNNKSSAKKKIGATLSHSNAAAGDTKKTTSEDVNNNCYDDSHGLSNGKSDKTNEETLQMLSEKKIKRQVERNSTSGRGGLMTEDKRPLLKILRERGECGRRFARLKLLRGNEQAAREDQEYESRRRGRKPTRQLPSEVSVES